MHHAVLIMASGAANAFARHDDAGNRRRFAKMRTAVVHHDTVVSCAFAFRLAGKRVGSRPNDGLDYT